MWTDTTRELQARRGLILPSNLTDAAPMPSTGLDGATLVLPLA